ncbi:uncharacterized protein N7446_013549 [Penicillium canescens]|uniref:uncharacterized protein n=1 Tax=Penicillium canescens TaxID=5083 RepID=UPI0026DF9DA6|nr:uncharacterized protein N7446_013549 [Penicillium canescens]KAJ6042483.1 hypothetical protein N7446_013549 [Penicillium canescens]
MASQPQGNFCLECNWDAFHLDGKEKEISRSTILNIIGIVQVMNIRQRSPIAKWTRPVVM